TVKSFNNNNMTTTKIFNALGLSYLRYDNFRETCFLLWAQKYAQEFAISLRALAIHDGLRNWYQDQWMEYVEKPFYRNYSEFFESAEPDTLFKIFDQYPE